MMTGRFVPGRALAILCRERERGHPLYAAAQRAVCGYAAERIHETSHSVAGFCRG
jgi:hypothetical protein